MKKIILSVIGICSLFLSCENELLEFQDEALLEGASSSLALMTSDCTPDLDGLELSLPDNVTVNTLEPECNTAYFALDILEGDLAGNNISAWCVDIEAPLDINENVTYDVYSSYEDLSGLSDLFANLDKFDEVNWILNQSFIGKESGITNAAGENYIYTYGHVQSAIWQLIDNTSCIDGDCDYLTCPTIGQWNSDDALISAEIAATAAAAGDGFVPQCGQQIAIILASSTKQTLIITLEVPEKEPCFECDGKITELELQYNGDVAANIVVKTKKEGEDGSKVVFEGNVEPGETFSFVGNDKKGTLGTEIEIYVDGDENTKIHTSCSVPVGPGLISGDFLVVSGASRNGGNLCPIDSTPGDDDCGECEGKVTKLELQYNGTSSGDIEVIQKKDNVVAFSGTINPGSTFMFSGNDKKGTLGTEIIIYINGSQVQKIHTSCSDPIGPGAIFGDFTVISGTSLKGGELCPVETPPGDSDDCNECDGKVTRLDLQYNGSGNNMIEVIQKKDNMVAFSANVADGEVFTFSGKDDKGTLGTEIIIYVNGIENQRIHTSCSDPIGAGAVFGDFTVIGGASRNGGELCPVDVVTPPSDDDCNECDGKVTRLDLQYSGSGNNMIEIIQKKDNMVAFSANVADGEVFTFSGKDDKGTLGTEIIIYVNGVENQRIHTSCSDPIGAGAIFGDFTVIGGASRNGGELCPVEPTPASNECDCDGKIVEMIVRYSGPNGVEIAVTDEDGNNSQTFSNVQTGDILPANIGNVGNWWYWSVDGNVEARIHTSCSDDILGNVDAEKSYFGNLGTYPDPQEDDDNGTFLVVSHTDENGNTCSIITVG